MKSLTATLKRKMERFIADPQLSQLELMRKQVAFYWTVVSVISIVILTSLAYIIKADIIGHFGLVLIVLYSIEIPLFQKHNFDFYQAIFLASVIITAFVFIVIFGGYTHSAGLVFVGLTCVISSILMKSVRVAFLLFFLYVGTIVCLAILNPYLHPHPDITPRVNFFFFIINTIWMSAAMMFFIITYLTERNKYQLTETARLKEIDEAKSQLFTNITHEFRTPITLISGFAEEINSEDEENVKALVQIKKQSKILLKLVNQILDLAKIDSNTMQIHYIQADIIKFLRYYIESFYSRAKSKGLEIAAYFHSETFQMDFDQEKLETVVTNLIVNAIKFTPEGGAIYFYTQRAGTGFFQFTVMDTGIGIAREDCKKIFNRFYQVAQDKYKQGNGIGLTIVREFVNLMNGTVEVESKLGIGTTFTVKLPVNNEAPLRNPEINESYGNQFLIDDNKEETPKNELPLLLIIDDNKDIINYLKKILFPQYRILEANNGNDGYLKAIEFVPDIIISDIMMPIMDGFEFLKKVKSELKTSHIPVLLLTAKTDHSAKLEGFEFGAEVFLEKPFDKEELFIRLRKLLDLRKILHTKYQNSNTEEADFSNTSSLDDLFINDVRRIIEKHLDDESFNIIKLCRELGMSHTQLYRKFAALTDTTVNKYIRQYRLHKAMNLLKNTDLTISQVSLEIGMPSLAYFSRIFTEEFDVNPSRVRKSDFATKRDAE